MRMDIQNTDQPVFGFQPEFGTGAQKILAILLSLSVYLERLWFETRHSVARYFAGWAMSSGFVRTITALVTAGHTANVMNSPDASGKTPSLGVDRVSRVGCIAG